MKVSLSEDFHQWHGMQPKTFFKKVISALCALLILTFLLMPFIGLEGGLIGGPLGALSGMIVGFFWKTRGMRRDKVVEEWWNKHIVGFVARLALDSSRQVVCHVELRNQKSYRFVPGTAVICVDLGGLSPKTYVESGSDELLDIDISARKWNYRGRPIDFWVEDPDGDRLHYSLRKTLGTIQDYLRRLASGEMEYFDLSVLTQKRVLRKQLAEIEQQEQREEDEGAAILEFPQTDTESELREFRRGPSPDEVLFGKSTTM